MKYYTTIEQSKKLLELGLSPESADWHYHYDFDFDELETCPTFSEEDDHYVLFPQDIPCWSVGALIHILPDRIMHNNLNCECFMSPNGVSYSSCFKGEEAFNIAWSNNPYFIDALFNCVCWLLENRYIKKGE